MLNNNSTINHNLNDKIALILQCLDQNKAEDILTINLHDKNDIADYMIVASGMSNTHINSLVGKVTHLAKHELHTKVAVEGLTQSKWVLISFHNLLINIFDKEARDYYQIEKMWLL